MSAYDVVEVGGNMRPLPLLFQDATQLVFDPFYKRSQPPTQEFSGLDFSALPAQSMNKKVGEATARLVIARNVFCDHSYSIFGYTNEQILMGVKDILATDGAFLIIDDDYCGGIDTEVMLKKGNPRDSYTELFGLAFRFVPVSAIPPTLSQACNLSRLQMLLGTHVGSENQSLPLWEKLQAIRGMGGEQVAPTKRSGFMKSLLERVLS